MFASIKRASFETVTLLNENSKFYWQNERLLRMLKSMAQETDAILVMWRCGLSQPFRLL